MYLRLNEVGTLFYSQDWLVRIRFFLGQQPPTALIDRAEIGNDNRWHYYPLEVLTDQAAEDLRNYLLKAAQDVPDSTRHKRHLAEERQLSKEQP